MSDEAINPIPDDFFDEEEKADMANWTQEELARYYETEHHIHEILNFLGEDAQREGLKDTPKRVTKSWQTLYGGYALEEDLVNQMTTFENEGCDEMVLVKDIDFFSMCEHHMLPFFGRAHIAYIPGKKIVGLSKLARVLDVYSRRLQNQERLTKQVTNFLWTVLDPKGVACMITGTHHCMACRGVQKINAKTVTSSLKGAFHEDPSTRSEFYSLVGAR